MMQLTSTELEHLLTDELSYEIESRGEEPKDTVKDKRVQLRKLIKKQAREKDTFYEPIAEEVDNDQITLVTKFIQNVANELVQTKGNIKPRDRRKWETRLTHHLNRVNRWKHNTNAQGSSAVSKEELEKKSKMIKSEINRLLSLLDLAEDNEDELTDDENKVNNDVQVNNEIDNGNVDNPIVRSVQNNEANVFNSECGTGNTRNNSIVNFSDTINVRSNNDHRNNPMVRNKVVRDAKTHKWGIKFSADQGSISLEYFLEQVDLKRISKGLTWDDVFPSVSDLLEGTAYTWYLANYKKMISWYEFEMRIRQAFSFDNFNVQLWRQCLNYKQQPHERVIEYVSKMKLMFNRLPSSMPMHMQVDTVLMNMLPEIRDRLNMTEFNNIDILEEWMLKAESQMQVTRLVSNEYNNYNTQKPRVMNRNFDRLKIREVTYRNPHSGNNQTNHKLALTAGTSGQNDHNRNSKHVYCFKCGKPGFTIITCSCNKQIQVNEKAQSELKVLLSK